MEIDSFTKKWIILNKHLIVIMFSVIIQHIKELTIMVCFCCKCVLRVYNVRVAINWFTVGCLFFVYEVLHNYCSINVQIHLVCILWLRIECGGRK